MCVTCVRTVASLTNSRAAISALARPRAINVSTSSSRSVSSSSSGCRTCAGRRSTDEVLDETPEERGREKRVARRNRPHRADELIARRVFEQESGGSGPHRLVDVLVEVERRQHQHARPIPVAKQPPRRLDSIDARHADVHQHHIRAQLARDGNGLAAVPRLADHLEIVLRFEDRPETRPDQRLVVRDEDANHAVPAGSRARTEKPPSARPPVSSEPPYNRTRSRMPVIPWPPCDPFALLLPSSSTSSSRSSAR
jgi:hypothetical protein